MRTPLLLLFLLLLGYAAGRGDGGRPEGDGSPVRPAPRLGTPTLVAPTLDVPDLGTPDALEPAASAEPSPDGPGAVADPAALDRSRLALTGRTLTDRTGRTFPASGLPHLDSALVHAGIRERPGNRGPEIDEWARGAGLAPGIPYCAAWIANRVKVAGAACLSATGDNVATALARTFTRSAVYIPAREVQLGRARVLPGDLAVWGFRRSAAGHIGMVVRNNEGFLDDPEGWPYEPPSGSCFETVEANTSCNGEGTARDGGGVCRRTRCGQTLGGMVLLGYARPSYPAR